MQFGTLESLVLLTAVGIAILLVRAPKREKAMPAGILVALLLTLGAFMYTARGTTTRYALTGAASIVTIVSLAWGVVETRRRSPRTRS